MCQMCGGNEGWVVPLVVCWLVGMWRWVRVLIFNGWKTGQAGRLRYVNRKEDDE